MEKTYFITTYGCLGDRGGSVRRAADPPATEGRWPGVRAPGLEE